MTPTPSLESLATRATEGDREALAQLVKGLQDDIYRLALQMLSHPTDAEDATQEILLRIITRLGTFRGESALRTWALRVAANHLLTTRRRRAERAEISFERYEGWVEESVELDRTGALPPLAADQQVLVEEVRLQCFQGLLLCLERPYRLAFILTDVLDLPAAEAAEILELTPAALRKRLSRARQALVHFTRRNCGLVRAGNPCRCDREARSALKAGRLRLDRRPFTSHETRDAARRAAHEVTDELDALGLTVRLFRDQPAYAAPDALLHAIGQRAGLR